MRSETRRRLEIQLRWGYIIKDGKAKPMTRKEKRNFEDKIRVMADKAEG